MAGKGGGAWKVAYADFATAMMAFFLVMWITSQNKAVKESVAQYFENPLGTESEARATSLHGIPGASADANLEGQQAGPHGSSVREQGTFVKGDNASDSLKERPRLHIFDRPDKTRSVGTMVLFVGDSMELTPDSQHQLSELVVDLRGKPHKIEIRGHAIRHPSTENAPAANPWDLSYARSVSTMRFLISCGIEPNRFRLSQEGGFEPYSNQGNQLKDQRNGRVEVMALDELTHEFEQTRERRAGNFVPATDELIKQQQGGVHAGAKADDKKEGGHGHGGAAADKKSDGHGTHGKDASHGKGKGHGGGH